MPGELRRQAQEDLGACIQSEFGQTIKISRPDNQEFKDFIGNSNDAYNAIDTETGLLIAGRTCHAVFLLNEVLDHFGQLPDSLWQVEFLEISPNKFRIKDVQPDFSQGILILIIGDSDVK